MFLKVYKYLEIFFFTLSCQERNIGQAPLSYQEIALAFTHLLHNHHTSVRRWTWQVNIRHKEPVWREICYIIQALCSTVEQYDAYPFRIPVDFRGFGSESIVQMALHSQLTLIGHKETGPTMPLLVFVYNTWSAIAPLCYLDAYIDVYIVKALQYMHNKCGGCMYLVSSIHTICNL